MGRLTIQLYSTYTRNHPLLAIFTGVTEIWQGLSPGAENSNFTTPEETPSDQLMLAREFAAMSNARLFRVSHETGRGQTYTAERTDVVV